MSSHGPTHSLASIAPDLRAPALDEDKRADIDEVVGMLTGNLEKIGEHGRRADGIVKSMLEHSRGGTGERREVDLNGLVEEALNLAYHGARAQDQNFEITLEREFAERIAPIRIVSVGGQRPFPTRVARDALHQKGTIGSLKILPDVHQSITTAPTRAKSRN